jgi:hypothetical protein
LHDQTAGYIDGATTFTALTDTPNSYVGQGGKYTKVKEDESGVEFVEFSLPAYPINFGTVPTSLYEGMPTTLTDASYTSGVSYVISNEVGCSIVNNLDGTFALTTTISDATTATFTITASKSGFSDGEYNGSITLTQVVLDGAVGIFNPSSSMGDLDTTFTTLTNITFSNEKAVVGDGTAEMISTTIDMGANGAIATDSYIRVEANNIAVTDDLDISKVASTKDISNQTALIVWDNGGSEEVLEIDVGVMSETAGLVSSTDPFNNGSLIAKYELDDSFTGGTDTTTATVGSNATATAVTSGTGVFGNCAVFNGSSSYITRDKAFFPIGELSVSMWFKTTATAYQVLLSTSGLTTGGDGIGVAFTGNASSDIGVMNNGTWLARIQSALCNWDDGNWHHIVVTWTNTTETNGLKVYIDGVNVGNATATGIVVSNDEFYIGRRGGGSYFNGAMDQVEIYNQVLTAEEASTLYTQQAIAYSYTETDNTKALYGKTPLALFENNTREFSISFDDGTNYADVDIAPIYEGSNIIKLKQTLPDESGIRPTAGNLFKAKITNSNKDEKIIEAYTKVYEDA